MLRFSLLQHLRFMVERLFVRGAHFQLLVVAAVIGLISITGGLLVMPTGEPLGGFADAVWWAFLRLTDPGYLGDDEGAWRRFVSTILTVSGYVVFLGALIAIMTQWLIARMRQLERGLTPVSYRNHIVILGWTSRTLPLVRELLGSMEGVRRFLSAFDTQRLRLVLLADDVTPERLQALRDTPGIGRRTRNIVLRSGTSLHVQHLHRVACLSAAAVIVPSGSQTGGGLVNSDVETIKALLSLNTQLADKSQLPLVVAEIQDLNKVAIARHAYQGPLEVVAGDAMISRLLAQNLLYSGLSGVYNELLTRNLGNEFFIRSDDRMVGHSMAAVAASYSSALFCGVLRRSEHSPDYRVMLNPPAHERVEAGDCLVLIARSYQETEAGSVSSELTVTPAVPRAIPQQPLRNRAKRLLVLGWNSKVPAFLDELSSYSSQSFSVDLVSTLPTAARVSAIESVFGQSAWDNCRHIEGDYTLEHTLRGLMPQNYDAIVLMSSDRLATSEEADARSIVGYLLLDRLLDEARHYPQVLLELSDPHNEALMDRGRSEILISPLLLSHVLAQVALRRELRMVFDELFTVGGAQMVLRKPQDYGCESPMSFADMEQLVRARGETALGLLRQQPDASQQRLLLNPPRADLLSWNEGDLLVVLSTVSLA